MNHGVDLKENKKTDKYLDFARENNSENLKLTVILIIVRVLGTFSKSLKKRSGGYEKD